MRLQSEIEEGGGSRAEQGRAEPAGSGDERIYCPNEDIVVTKDIVILTLKQRHKIGTVPDKFRCLITQFFKSQGKEFGLYLNTSGKSLVLSLFLLPC